MELEQDLSSVSLIKLCELSDAMKPIANFTELLGTIHAHLCVLYHLILLSTLWNQYKRLNFPYLKGLEPDLFQNLK